MSDDIGEGGVAAEISEIAAEAAEERSAPSPRPRRAGAPA